jgi:hypothetical protein
MLDVLRVVLVIIIKKCNQFGVSCVKCTLSCACRTFPLYVNSD